MFDPQRFTLFAGPCALEDDALNVEVAEGVRAAAAAAGLPVVFKASFDKANRSRLGSPRGPGLAEGLERLRTVRTETGLPVLTDVHEPSQAERVAHVADVIQVPAFLCRQTDLLVAAGRTGKPVNVKKGQWMSPEAMAGSVEKVRSGGDGPVIVTERGSAFGYGDLVVDMRAFRRVRQAAGVPVVFDATHSVQRPGRGKDGSSGGSPEDVAALARAAVAAGCHGLFLETHPNPPAAPSDGANMLPLSSLAEVLEQVAAVRRALQRDTAP